MNISKESAKWHLAVIDFEKAIYSFYTIYCSDQGIKTKVSPSPVLAQAHGRSGEGSRVRGIFLISNEMEVFIQSH